MATDTTAVYFGSYDSHFYALSKGDGSQLWRYAAGGIILSGVTVDGHLQRVFFGSLLGHFACLNTVSGAPVWGYNTGSSISSGTAADSKYVYFGCSDGSFYALDKASGTGKGTETEKGWRYVCGGAVNSGVAVSVSGDSEVSGVVYFGSGDGVFHAVGAS